jgi:hypothetical protein
VSDIWKELAEPDFPVDAPYYEKLSLLAQLKTTEAVAGYTKALTWLTVVIAVGTLCQGVFAALAYLRPPR